MRLPAAACQFTARLVASCEAAARHWPLITLWGLQQLAGSQTAFLLLASQTSHESLKKTVLALVHGQNCP
jgi:hypothetical protein